MDLVRHVFYELYYCSLCEEFLLPDRLENPTYDIVTKKWYYTGPCLQRVRLLRALGYNEQLFLSKKDTSGWRQCSKTSVIIMSTYYNEQIFVKRGPV